MVQDKPNTLFWVCNRRPQGKPRCITFKFSVRRGTVFENSNLSIARLFRLLFHFSQGHQATDVSTHTGIGGVNAYSVKRFYNRLHDAIKEWMELRGIQALRPIQEAQQQNRGVFCWLVSVVAEIYTPYTAGISMDTTK